MKLRTMLRMGALTMALSLVSTSLMGGTLAKYTTEYTDDDSVTVAAWSFTADDGDEGTETFTFDLFGTETLLQPGSSADAVEITLSNGSDVAAEYTVDIAVELPSGWGESYDTVDELPLTFTAETDDDDSTGDFDSGFSGTIAADDGSDVKITIGWAWPYEIEDKTENQIDDVAVANDADTAFGEVVTSEDELKVTVTVTGTQADPDPT